MGRIKEIWLPIKGYKGVYEVSNLGRIKSLSRPLLIGGQTPTITIEKILKQQTTHKGYLSIGLCNGSGKKKSCVVHRLVAIAFIANPQKLPEVNHKKGIKTDNRVSELEWINHKDNCKHAFANGIAKISDKCKKAVADKNRLYRSEKHYMSRKIVDNNTGITYNSIRDAAKGIGVSQYALYSRVYHNRLHKINLSFL